MCAARPTAHAGGSLAGKDSHDASSTGSRSAGSPIVSLHVAIAITPPGAKPLDIDECAAASTIIPPRLGAHSLSRTWLRYSWLGTSRSTSRLPRPQGGHIADQRSKNRHRQCTDHIDRLMQVDTERAIQRVAPKASQRNRGSGRA